MSNLCKHASSGYTISNSSSFAIELFFLPPLPSGEVLSYLNTLHTTYVNDES